MADLPYIEQRQEVSITGQDSTGDQVNYVSADVNGNMSVKDYADGPVAPGTAASVSTLVGVQYNSTLPTLTTTQQSSLQADSNGRLLFSPQSLADFNATGTIAALNGFVAINSQGRASVIITVTGTWVANLVFEGFDGTNWIVTAGLTQPAGGITEALSSNGTVLINSGGYAQIRIIATAYTSGTANIFMNAGIGPSLIEVYNDSGNPLITKAQVEDGVGNAITSTTINSKQRLDVDLASEGIDNTSVPFATQLIGAEDPTGKLQNLISVPSGELFVRDVLNVSVQNRAQSVTTSAAEALGGATILVNRKMLQITPTNGTIYYGATGVTTVTGTPIFPNNTLFLDVTDNVHIFVIAAATTDARIIEYS